MLSSLLYISSGIALSHVVTKTYSYLSKKRHINRNDSELPAFLPKYSPTPFVVVVGIGGVGSHVIMSLLRSGITHLRVIDYDLVTLSSLNRHAFAVRGDVGKLKAHLVKEYAYKYNPNILIETIDDAFLVQHAEQYIKRGDPTYVIDCIDDLDSKIDLIHYCIENNINIISSMGAAGKCDPSKIRFSVFDRIGGDAMGKRIRYWYNKKYKELPRQMMCVYSTEKTFKGLSDLDESKIRNPEMYRVNFNERIRSLPVFACLPSAFGQCIAGRVVGELEHYKFAQYEEYKEGNKEKELMIGHITLSKSIEDFKQFEINKRGTAPNELFLVYDDYLRIAQTFKFCSSVSQKPGRKMKFVRWRPYLPPTVDNIVILNKTEMNQMFNVRAEADLVRQFGEDTVKRIDKALASVLQYK